MTRSLHAFQTSATAMSARKKLMEEIYDQFLVCKICYDVYSRPKTLSCLHTFCEVCIAKQHDAERQRAYRSERGAFSLIVTLYVIFTLCNFRVQTQRVSKTFLSRILTSVNLFLVLS